VSIEVGCYIISRDNAEEIITCLREQEYLANSVMLAIDSKVSEETIAAIENIKHSYLPDLTVYKQEWQDDFAWARNDCLCRLLEKCPTLDYVYWVDSDDVWDSSIDFSLLKERLEAARPNSVILPYEYLDGIALNRKRFWKVVEGTYSPYCWVGAAHEVENLVMPELAGEVIWDGYKLIHNKTETPEESTNKRIRNIKILSKALKEDPTNVRSRFYLSREYYHNSDYDNAITHYNIYLEQSKNIAEKYQAYLDLMYIYVHIKEYDRAIDAGHFAIELYPNVAFAATILRDVYRIQEKWALAAIWYEYAVNSPHAPVIFDFLNLRTIAPLRWLSVACQRLGRMDDASYYHMEAGNCKIQDGLQEHNSVWLFNNAYVPEHIKDHFEATRESVDGNLYMIVKNFKDPAVKESIKSILVYNSEMCIVRIIDEDKPEAACVIFKGYNNFIDTMTKEEKEKIINYKYEDLVHPTQFTLFKDFYEASVSLALDMAGSKPLTVVELGSDQGLSARFFINYLQGFLSKITFIDTNMHPHLYPLIDYKKTFFIQDLAENAVEQFEDNSIDILHHDVASHSHSAGRKELALWIPKLKKTGVIIMHDVGVSRDHAFSGRKVLEELRYPWAVCYCNEGELLPDVAPAVAFRIDLGI
jgi:tetratricopeptide (TPR) repeat protein